MRGVLLAGVLAVLAVTAAESLSCVQCNSLTKPCVNSSLTECPSDANTSCTSFLANSSIAGNVTLYQDKACSAENCTETRAFTVHVSDAERFHFASECCQGKACNDTGGAPDFVPGDASSLECPACYGSNETSCGGKSWKCYKGERCVSLIAEFKNDTQKFVLKGCSLISDSNCQFLSAANRTVGGVILRKFECGNSTDTSSTPVPTPTNSTGVSPSSPTDNAGCRGSFAPVALASLLLGLLL
ncbi:ly6/PLAUR domain-containing protein 8 [Manis javanica]|uniref:ly6/PLAUR domain-containing protein 8 n=1 Tax=Manis javanica TaxID=9974 RepID=UPI000813D01C|nr:ly6/PLAUR domain-containing protein 8 [Manis javanica]XP_036864676.1 ly6/PLAUR domain-containing protein 8 [Manis javanica]